MKFSTVFIVLAASLVGISEVEAQESQAVNSTAWELVSGPESADNSKVQNLEASGDDEILDLDDADVSNGTADKEPVQSGPFIDLFGPTLLSLKMIDETHAQMMSNLTSDVLRGKSVVGVYFSADWCGPCRKFTPELVQFYEKLKSRRGKENSFEIIWVSRCRDMDSFGQYFTHMKWPALPPDQAMGQRGQMLFEKYKVKGIPALVLLDEVGNVITLDARNKIPQDKMGIGFPWRNPLATLYITIIPKSLRHIVKAQIVDLKDKLVTKIKSMVPLPKSG